MSISKITLITKHYTLLVFMYLYATPIHSSTQFKNINALQNQGSEVSAIVKNLNTGEILGQISPKTHLIPASLTKIGIASQALENWGPNKIFSSQFFARGELKNGVLNGDFVFYGGGDPGLINENMPDMIKEIKKIGLREITGSIIVNNSKFGALKQDPARAARIKYSENAYDAPLSAAAVNYSVLGVTVTPASKVDLPPKISIDPYMLPSIVIKNHAKTVSAKGKTRLFVARNSTQDKDFYTVTGTISLNAGEQKIYRSVSNPDRYAAEVLGAYLSHAGVKVSNTKYEIETTALKSSDKLLFTVSGSPLSNHLDNLLKQSNNFIADMLLMDLNIENGIKLNKTTPFTILERSDVLEKYLRSKLKDSQIVIKSGSGLTPQNRLSANNLVSLLEFIYEDKDSFNTFLNSLTTPGEIGTLEHRFRRQVTQAQKHMLRAKTGTLTSPCFVVSLAGYAQDANKDWISFAVIVNSKNSKKSPDMLTIQSAVDNDIMSFLTHGKTRL